MAKRLAGRYGYPEAPHEFDVTLHPDRLDEPYRWRKPRTVFVCSMSDLFHKDVPDEYVERVWATMRHNPAHTFIVLTKRPERMAKLVHQFTWQWTCIDGYSNRLLPNVIGMVTAENQECADERVPRLIKAPFAIRGVSVEPMLGPINLGRLVWFREGFSDPGFQETYLGRRRLDWVACGFETGPGARRGDFAWARDLRDQCQQAGVPFFWKRPSPGQETPPDLMVREWPHMGKEA